MHARETLSSLHKDAEDIETEIKKIHAEIDLFRPAYSSARIVLQNPNQLSDATRRSSEAVIEIQERLEDTLRELLQIQKQKSDAIIDRAEKFDDDGIDSKSPTLH